MLAHPLVKTGWGIPHRDIFNMPTLDAISNKHNNKQTEPRQLELCNTTHKSHNDNKIQKYNKKIIKNKNTTTKKLFIYHTTT